METTVCVYVDLEGSLFLVGRLWARVRKQKESATFEYAKEWLNRSDKFALEPALHLGEGTFHTDSLFGAMGDSAPDRWGRVLMRRAERKRADLHKETPRTLFEMDYLLRVDDEARLGALRFSLTEGGPFLAPPSAVRIPPLIELPRLLSAVEHMVADSENEEDLRLLLAPGSSLGGARPKASIRDRDGHLAIAKFAHRDDAVNMVGFEALALTLAQKAGIVVPDFRVENVANKKVLILRRFDRDNNKRLPFLSALSMLQAKDNEMRSYLELVDILRQQSSDSAQDITELFRRMVFNLLISNTDDHLRNHGFLYDAGKGWYLAPAYDLNPVPVDVKPRFLSTSITLEDNAASLELALEVAEYFDLSLTAAKQIISEVAQIVKNWRKEAMRLQLITPEIERMASAFEHAELRSALQFK